MPSTGSSQPPARTVTHGPGLTPSEPRGCGFITLAGVMLFIAAAANALPVWSVIVLVIDGLIIYGLCVYGFGDQ